MRKIIFRGFSKGLCKWIYGDLEHAEEEQAHIWPVPDSRDNRADAVSPESIGQYTGLKDREGREIYEGDILSFVSEEGYVAYCVERAQYVVHPRQGKYEKSLAFICETKKPVIIGNTYENPELLETFNCGQHELQINFLKEEAE